MNTKISIHNRNLEARKQGMKSWSIPDKEKKDLVRFLTDLGLGKVNKGVKVSETRQLKYLDLLRVPLIYFKKDSGKLTLKDVESFEKDLTSNKIQSYKKKPFAHSTKADLRRILKIYLKWQLGETDKFRKLTDWFDLREQVKTPDYLSEKEVEGLYKACKNNEERFIIALLFDSGARVEEFMNIRYEDVQLPEANDNYVRIAIKEEYSKTKGRTISLYWKYCLAAVRDYLQDREKEGIKSDEPVFARSYDATRQFLYRLGKNVLSKKINPHLLRHSSATYYANKLNRQELCYRYGWKFNSNMPDVYISRAGMENKDLDKKFQSTELEDVKKELERMKQQYALYEESLKQVQEQLEGVAKTKGKIK